MTIVLTFLLREEAKIHTTLDYIQTCLNNDIIINNIIRILTSRIQKDIQWKLEKIIFLIKLIF